MRPFARRLAAPVLDACDAGGAIGVLTRVGVEVLDPATLATRAVTAWEVGSTTRALTWLSDGRFLAHGEGRFSPLAVGAVGGGVEEIDGFFDAIARTQSGFVAARREGTLVDRAGARATLEGAADALAWDGGALLVDDGRVRVLDGDGRVARTLALELDEVLGVTNEGVLCLRDDEVRLVDLEGATAWSFARPGARHAIACGARVVLGGWGVRTAWVLGRDGALAAEVPLPGPLWRAAPLGDGVVVTSRGPALTWWRPGGVTSLELDVEGRGLARIEGGVVAWEDDVLWVFRPDTDGPEIPALDPGPIPLDAPLVVDGRRVTVRAGGRFVLRGETADGFVAVRPGSAFRQPATAEEARAVVDALCARRFDGAGRLAEDASLHGRALFTPDALEGPARYDTMRARRAFFAELADALGVPLVHLAAALSARRFPLEPPRALEGWAYAGAFTCEGRLAVCDPCYLGRKEKTSAIALSLSVDAEPGRWHAYVRAHEGDNAELVAVHEGGFDVVACEIAGNIGVDAGLAGVFEPKAKLPEDLGMVELDGVLHARGRGVVVRSGVGDGLYPVFVGRASSGRVAKIRIWFLGPGAPDLDGTVARPTSGGGARAYSPRERFDLGEHVLHPKFGEGLVVRAPSKDKIEVAFADETRTLVHGLAK